MHLEVVKKGFTEEMVRNECVHGQVFIRMSRKETSLSRQREQHKPLLQSALLERTLALESEDLYCSLNSVV